MQEFILLGRRICKMVVGLKDTFGGVKQKRLVAGLGIIHKREQFHEGALSSLKTFLGDPTNNVLELTPGPIIGIGNLDQPNIHVFEEEPGENAHKRKNWSWIIKDLDSLHPSQSAAYPSSEWSVTNVLRTFGFNSNMTYCLSKYETKNLRG